MLSHNNGHLFHFQSSTSNGYRYEEQVCNVLRGIEFLNSLDHEWYLHINLQLLGTFIPGTDLIDQIEKRIVLPPLSTQEKQQLGFIPLSEFVLTNTLEAIWSFCVIFLQNDFKLFKGNFPLND